jgi:hypothetical protein
MSDKKGEIGEIHFFPYTKKRSSIFGLGMSIFNNLNDIECTILGLFLGAAL